MRRPLRARDRSGVCLARLSAGGAEAPARAPRHRASAHHDRRLL